MARGPGRAFAWSSWRAEPTVAADGAANLAFRAIPFLQPAPCGTLSFGGIPSRGNDGLPRDFRAAGPTPDLRPRSPGGGADDRCDARVPGQLAPLRSSGPSP